MRSWETSAVGASTPATEISGTPLSFSLTVGSPAGGVTASPSGLSRTGGASLAESTLTIRSWVGLAAVHFVEAVDNRRVHVPIEERERNRRRVLLVGDLGEPPRVDLQAAPGQRTRSSSRTPCAVSSSSPSRTVPRPEPSRLEGPAWARPPTSRRRAARDPPGLSSSSRRRIIIVVPPSKHPSSTTCPGTFALTTRKSSMSTWYILLGDDWSIATGQSRMRRRTSASSDVGDGMIPNRGCLLVGVFMGRCP